MKAEEQVCVIFAGVNGYLDNLLTSEIRTFESRFLEHIRNNHSSLLQRVRESGDLKDADIAELKSAIPLFISEGGFRTKGQ